jgi:hypothetical protein
MYGFKMKLCMNVMGTEAECKTLSQNLSFCSDAPKTEKIDVWDWYRINSNVAIWAREKENI